MVDFNKMPCIYWNDRMKIEWLERHIIVHSIIYYELNENVITDKEFDSCSKQLLKLSREHKEIFRNSEYFYIFSDFDANTGFYIWDRLNKSDKVKLKRIALAVVKNKKGEKSNGN